MKKEGKRLKKRENERLPFDDKRFAHVKSDPKFANIKTEDRKIVIEKRFSGLLTDEKFADSATVDKRGRPIRRKKNNLNSLYSVEVDEDEAEDAELKKDTKKKKKKKQTAKIAEIEPEVEPEESEEELTEDEDLEDEDDSDEDDDGVVKVDLARGDGNMSSSDDDDTSDESDWEITQDVEQQLNVAQLDTNCEQVEWASRRLAACNLDWDMFKAEDIYILVNSFVPTGGDVTNVAIYLSDFGKEKLEVEESLGPRIQVDHLNQNDEMDPTDLKVEFAVRKYNIEKLKYYYAIIECDSETTATKIYENCDGMLFENSGLKMDLRFVPDDMEFDEDRIKEKMQKDDINLKRYKPKTSMKSAATRTGTDIKWDDEDYERKQMVQEAFNDDYDAKNTMMADSDSEDDATVENRRNALLSLIEEKPKKSDLKIEWDDQKEASDSDDEDIEKALAKRAEGHSSDEESPSKALKTEGTKKSGYKAYLEKSKERRKEKKLRLRQSKQQVGTDVDEFEGPQKKKARSRADLKSTDYGTATAVLADERFSALVTDSAFTIEQTNKHAKGTKLIELQVQAKKAAAPATKKEESLVDSLKSKSAKWTSKKRK